MKKILFLILILVIGGSAFLYMRTKYTSTKTKYDITLEESKILAENPSIIILDVRPKSDLASGVLHNSINIDVTQPEFQDALQKLDKDREYLVYCNVGQRSAQAIKKMEEAGFTKLYHIRDGIVEWKKAGLPIDTRTQTE